MFNALMSTLTREKNLTVSEYTKELSEWTTRGIAKYGSEV